MALAVRHRLCGVSRAVLWSVQPDVVPAAQCGPCSLALSSGGGCATLGSPGRWRSAVQWLGWTLLGMQWCEGLEKLEDSVKAVTGC